jgi:stage IV sporulation protein FB
MSWSLRVFTIRGIDIKVHLSFILILFWAAFQWGVAMRGGVEGAIWGLVAILLLFVCVTLHELGHGFEAMHFGIKVQDITLWPIGGVARLETMPDKPVQELRIALAGPVVNFLIVLGLWLLMELILGKHVSFDPWKVVLGFRYDELESLIDYLIMANLSLGLFNLIPAFPMDGGRVLRSLLAFRISFSKATRIAVMVGQGVAILLGFIGFMSGGFSLILVALFVFWGAGQEGQAAEVRAVLQGVRVRHALSHQIETLAPSDPLSRAVDLTLGTFQSDFPVLDGDHLLGLLAENDLLKAIGKLGPETPVSRAMRAQFNTVTMDTSLLEAQQAIASSQSSAIAVVATDGQFVGLLTLRDISEVYRLLSINPALVRR